MLVNIASRDDIGRAMAQGVNYPKGLLLAWADAPGISSMVDPFYAEYSEDRCCCSGPGFIHIFPMAR